MRAPDELPLNPEIAARLDAIDATLAGEPVDPSYAEVAELALLLASERPRPRSQFAAELDARVERRFRRAPGAPARSAREPGARDGGRRGRVRSRVPGHVRGRGWSPWAAAGGAATALAAVIAAAVVVIAGGSGTSRLAQDGALRLPPQALAGHKSASSAAGASAAPRALLGSISSRAETPVTSSPPTPAAASPPTPAAASPKTPAAAGVVAPSQTTFGAAAPGRTLSLPQNGRRTIQSAQLALSTAPGRIDVVAQEAFDVIGAEQGIVRHSTVTATGGSDGYAELQLSVPSGNLATLMNRLSQLRYARVASRTDSSQDVNDRYVAEVRRLGDERALRTSLLKQLAAATTQQQIDSLKAQLHDAEAQIAADETALAALSKQVNLSQVDVTISAGTAPIGPPHAGGGGFTLGRAAHDAGRVLTVAAGIALIALAALVPLGLVAALVAWIALVVRRRGREQALDAV